MKKEAVLLILLILVSTIVFAAPTVAPPAIQNGESSAQEDQATEPSIFESDTTNQAIPTNTQQTTTTNTATPQETSESQTTILLTNDVSFTLLLIFTIINTIAIIVLISASTLHIFKDKHPYLAFKFKQKPAEYTNTKDSVQYTETFNKLQGYIEANLSKYSIDAIKATLMQQGFTEQEIDAVYYEIQNK